MERAQDAKNAQVNPRDLELKIPPCGQRVSEESGTVPDILILPKSSENTVMSPERVTVLRRDVSMSCERTEGNKKVVSSGKKLTWKVPTTIAVGTREYCSIAPVIGLRKPTQVDVVTILPTALVAVRRDEKDRVYKEGVALLDSGASKSFVSKSAVARFGLEEARGGPPLRVHGVGGSVPAQGVANAVIYPHQVEGGSPGKAIAHSFAILDHLGTTRGTELSCFDLDISSKKLADSWPRRERQMDFIIGQDILWKVLEASGRKLSNDRMKLLLTDSVFGVLVSGLHSQHGKRLPRAAKAHIFSASFSGPPLPEFGVKGEELSKCEGQMGSRIAVGEKRHTSVEENADVYLSLATEERMIGYAETNTVRAISSRSNGETALFFAQDGNEKEDKKPHETLAYGRSLQKLLDRYFSMEMLGIEPASRSEVFSEKDKWAIKSFEESVKQLGSGEYQVGLTFSAEKPPLMDNKGKALRLLNKQEERFDKNPELEVAYGKAIQEYLDQGDIELCVEEGIDGETFYLPHQAVIRPDKLTSKCRIVFNGSSKGSNGVSLNECLLKGPQGAPDLVKILVNFRWRKVAFAGDVKRMYLCIFVREEDRDHLRFLWRESRRHPIATYRFRKVPFGLRDAPFLAQQVFKHHALKYAEENPQAVKIITEDRWVDDLLSSSDTESQAKQIIASIKNMMAEGGFQLKKWVSSHESVMLSIPEEDRIDLGNPIVFRGSEGFDETQTEKVSALGVGWFVGADTFGLQGDFQAEMNGEVTKRLIASRLASVFDPLGFMAPFLITGKLLLHEIWKEEKQQMDALKKSGVSGNELDRKRKRSWDVVLPEGKGKPFVAWWSQVKDLKGISFPRCLVDKERSVKARHLHVFVDASPKAFACCAYVVAHYTTGGATSHLVASKTRVATDEQLTMPRLELLSALIGSRLGKSIRENQSVSETHFWTDSSVALLWIQGEASDYKTYVSNRVREIQANSQRDQWRHVPGVDNPADLATRGLSVEEFGEMLSFWEQGPTWLVDRDKWPVRHFNLAETTESSSEKKNRAELFSSSVEPETALFISQKGLTSSTHGFLTPLVMEILSRLMERVSTLDKVIRTLSFLLFADWQNANEDRRGRIMQILIMHQQAIYFREELAALENGKAIENKSLEKVAPFLDKGLIRVAGRFGRIPRVGQQEPDSGQVPGEKDLLLPPEDEIATDTFLADCGQHETCVNPPMLIPKGRLFHLVVMDIHEKLAHKGTGFVHYVFRKLFWTPKAYRRIQSVLLQCSLCRRRLKACMTQGMADLPPWRMEAEPRPFAHTGVDYFGPLWSFHPNSKKGKQLVAGEKDHKVWVLLFTCMQIRAVHLELVDSQSTEALMLAIRRFIAARGRPVQFHSDNAKSFRQAGKEFDALAAALKRTSKGGKSVLASVRDIGVKWTFQAEHAPWWGALHERLVRTVKEVLRVSLGTGHFTRDEIDTHVKEAEAIVNSRPLADAGEDPGEILPITPSGILFGYDLIEAPFPLARIEGPKSDVAKLWKRRLHVRKVALERFQKDYIQSLFERKKWHDYDKEKISVGDVVLVQEQEKRSYWPLGRVLALHEGRDGHVRSVTLRMRTGVTRRPLQRLVLLEDAPRRLPQKPDGEE